MHYLSARSDERACKMRRVTVDAKSKALVLFACPSLFMHSDWIPLLAMFAKFAQGVLLLA